MGTVCAFSPDGTGIAAAADLNTLKIWDAHTGAELAALPHPTGLTCCAYSPDGTRLVTALNNDTLKLWDVGSGTALLTLIGHSDSVNTCAFSPDGRRIVSGSNDMTVRIWDAATGALLNTLTGHTARVNSCVFSPDGQFVLSAASDAVLKLWDPAATPGAPPDTRHSAPIAACVYSPDGALLAVVAEDRSLSFRSAESGAKVGTLVVDDERARTTTQRDRPSTAWGCAFASNAAHLLTWFDRWETEDYQVRIWDVGTCKRVRTLAGHTWEVHAATFSPDGAQIASVSSDGTLRCWDAVSGSSTLERKLTRHGRALGTACVYAPGGRYLLTASASLSPEVGSLSVWDVASGALRVRVPGQYGCCAFAPDGATFVGGDHDGTLRVCDARTGVAVATLEGHTGNITACGYSPDGRTILSVSADRTMRLWDARTGRMTATHSTYSLASPRFGVDVAVFSPDAGRIVSTSSDETVRLWDASTGRELAEFRVGAVVTTLGFRPGAATSRLEIDSGGCTSCGLRRPSQACPWSRPSRPGIPPAPAGGGACSDCGPPDRGRRVSPAIAAGAASHSRSRPRFSTASAASPLLRARRRGRVGASWRTVRPVGNRCDSTHSRWIGSRRGARPPAILSDLRPDRRISC